MEPAGPPTEPVAITVGEGQRRVLLKWHQLRRRAGDPPWSIPNLRSGMAAGASLEIDVRTLADGAWVCLHDDVLDEETDGHGPVNEIDSAAVGKLRIAGTDQPPPLLAEIADIVALAPDRGGCLQLDLKEPLNRLSPEVVASFAAVVAPIAPRCLLSGTDWAAVRVLGAAVPSLRLGFDPLDMAVGRSFDERMGFTTFVDQVVATAPTAAAFYVHYRFVLAALASGVNPLLPLKAQGAMVDVWTLDPTTPGIGDALTKIVAAGADQITTNDPVGLSRIWRSPGSVPDARTPKIVPVEL